MLGGFINGWRKEKERSILLMRFGITDERINNGMARRIRRDKVQKIAINFFLYINYSVFKILVEILCKSI